MLEQYGISFPYAQINENTIVCFVLNGGRDDALVCGQSVPPGGPLCVQGAHFCGAPFSHLFTELKISPIEVHISAIQLEISPIKLKISPNQLEISTNRPI